MKKAWLLGLLCLGCTDEPTPGDRVDAGDARVDADLHDGAPRDAQLDLTATDAQVRDASRDARVSPPDQRVSPLDQAVPDAGSDVEPVDRGVEMIDAAPTDRGVEPPPPVLDYEARALGACRTAAENLEGVRSSCERIEIECGGVSPAVVELHLYRPQARPTGMVVVGGGNGVGHYIRPNAGGDIFRETLRQWVDAGHLVVDRAWEIGWFGRRPDGLRDPACRYAALVHWLNTAVHPGGGTCVTGNSGGSSEIGYALSFWGLDQSVDTVVVSGGPPMARLDLGCLPDADWRAACAARWPEVMDECPAGLGPFCQLTDRDDAVGPRLIDAALETPEDATQCTGMTITPQRARRESILNAEADLHFDGVDLTMLHARGDCTEAPMLGWSWYQAITSAKRFALVADAQHTIQISRAGVAALTEHLIPCRGARPPAEPAGAGCRANLDCQAERPDFVCVRGACQPAGAGMCRNNAECADGDPCTRDQCADGVCRSQPYPGECAAGEACENAAQCDDADACSRDACVEGRCQHRRRDDCR